MWSSLKLQKSDPLEGTLEDKLKKAGRGRVQDGRHYHTSQSDGRYFTPHFTTTHIARRSQAQRWDRWGSETDPLCSLYLFLLFKSSLIPSMYLPY